MTLPCLPLIQERFWNKIKRKEPYRSIRQHPDFKMCMFPQQQGTFLLGLETIYDHVDASEYITVIEDCNSGLAGVFLGERLVDIVSFPDRSPDRSFFHNFSIERMAGCDYTVCRVNEKKGD